jgi:signal transduction histidine kinase
VLGFAQLLALDPLSPAQARAVDHILRGGRHLLEMIEDVLDMAQIETGRLDVALEPVDVDDLLSDVLAVMRPIAAARQVQLVYDAAGAGSGRRVIADRRRLRQVLLQLMSNGIKYNQPLGRVDIAGRVFPDQNQLRLSVTDTGCGIRPADVAGLFVPFEGITLKRSDIEGAGIGLALSFRLVSIMGGRMEVQSEFGVGSTFSVTIPLAAAAEDRVPVDAGSRSGARLT